MQLNGIQEDLLFLHSNEIGDVVGTVKVLKIHKEENSDTTN